MDEKQDDPAFDEKEELDAGIPYNEFPWLRETLREESQKLRDGFRSPNIKIKLYKAQNGRCNAPCGKNGKGRKFPIDIFEVDHIDPRSKGGKDIDENLQLLCPTCNRRKGNMSMQDFVDKFAQKKIPFDKSDQQDSDALSVPQDNNNVKKRGDNPDIDKLQPKKPSAPPLLLEFIGKIFVGAVVMILLVFFLWIIGWLLQAIGRL